jgi:hypothetical protein
MPTTSTGVPPLGLLLDVDGPIASPVSRTVAIPSILDDLVTLTAAGVPIAFITGRSDEFIAENVIAPLLEHGLGEALARPVARMIGIFEKGAVSARVDAQGLRDIHVDSYFALPHEFTAAVRELVADYSHSMFFDETKRAMVSVEQNTDVPAEVYLEERQRFDEEVFEIARHHGVGLRWGDREIPDAAGLVPFRIDQTIISTDIESVALDKDRGAEQALAYFSSLGPLPAMWRSVGDSRGDYLMADHVHAAGLEVAHVDVRPSDGVLERPYPVIIEGDLVHDEAGAAFLRYWVEKLGLLTA